MTSTTPVVTLSPRDYDAFLFDLDGVLTWTSRVRAAAWKKLFDRFLQRCAARTGEAFVPFDIEADYRRYVDGKARYDGVASFLQARGIELPLGSPEDGPEAETVHGLGSLKDQYFSQQLEQRGVEIFEPAIELVRTLRQQDIKTAVVSSSKNCASVLESAGIAQLFDTRVDGVDVIRQKLRGKPAPDAFLEAARRLKVEARARSSSRTPSPASRRAAPVDSAASSASIASVNPRRCARPAPTLWWAVSPWSRLPSSRLPRGPWSTKASSRPMRAFVKPYARSAMDIFQPARPRPGP